MNRNYFKFIFFAVAFILGSCKEFLDEKPLSSLATLESLDDYKAIVQNEIRMNGVYPFCYDYSSDYFYLDEKDFNALDETGRNAYTWTAQPAHQNNWNQNYVRIYDANVVLDGIDDAQLGNWTENDRKHVKGTAYFFKAFSLLHLAAIYAPAYEPGNSVNKLGVPLRYSSDINEKIERASLEETFRHIEELLLKAAALLPATTETKTLPTKEAAWATLARHYLNMQEYARAATYADSCLTFNNKLIDYNDLDPNATTTQFPELNEEVILHATKSDFSGMLSSSKAKIDTTLYKLYSDADLRRVLFYRTNAAGITGFYGDYAGSLNTAIFSGIARDEVYLILSESLIRTGDISRGVLILNKLLEKRLKTETFKGVEVTDAAEALDLVLKERRKELAFRAGLRWMDLKRLNLAEPTEITLHRKLGDTDVSLAPNSVGYVFKIPNKVISISGMEQNP